jgi:hypothetical protein
VTAPAAIRTRPPSSLARSCITTVSAPSGMTPPVKMRAHCPAPMVTPLGLPAKGRPYSLESRLALRRKIGEAHRIAVHRRAVVAGHIERRDDIDGEDPAKRRAQMEALGRGDRGQERADQLARAVDRHRVRVVVVGAGDFAQRLG